MQWATNFLRGDNQHSAKYSGVSQDEESENYSKHFCPLKWLA